MATSPAFRLPSSEKLLRSIKRFVNAEINGALLDHHIITATPYTVNEIRQEQKMAGFSLVQELDELQRTPYPLFGSQSSNNEG